MKVLVLSGGGSKGAFQAGVVKSLVDRGMRWDAIAGISVGALNASFLAQFPKERQAEGVQQLVKFWKEVKGNSSVYKRWFPFGRLHAMWKGGLYNTSPLEKTVKANVDQNLLACSGVKLLIGAVCLESGEYRYVSGDEPNIHEWILASSAFPVAFPPRKIEGQAWIDGGVRDQTPITDVLDLKPEHIDVVLTGPLGEPVASFPTADSENGLQVALRTANLMADEIFNSDLDRVPEASRPFIKIYSPPRDAKMSEPLTFDPQQISYMYEVGLQVGMR